MKRITLLFLIFVPSLLYANAIQDAINNATDGATIILSDGLYDGSINISKSINIIGDGDNVVIRGSGSGSVITVTANHVTIKNIGIMGSGNSHESVDSCISVKNVNSVKVIDNRISDCLFGVNFEGVNRGNIEYNTITSKEENSLGLKGDGIRLWYSHSNVIRGNKLKKVRDTVFWYSSANRVENNETTDSRYSVHFMYADRNFIMNNTFKNNSVGIFLMYSSGSRISGNKILNAIGPFGIGIGFKEVSDCLVTDNYIMYNARGLYLDQSPYLPNTVNRFTSNKILYNTVGVLLHGLIFGSYFEQNNFVGNIETIHNDTPSKRLELNEWYRNYWDEYEGFDRNKDGYGDTPYENIIYADRIAQYSPSVKFFHGSPLMSILNFISRLLPFSDPEFIATDPQPRIKKDEDLSVTQNF